MIPFEFHRELWYQKTRVMGRSCGDLRDPTFSHFDKYRSVTDTHTQTDRPTDRHTTTAYTALSIASCGKNINYSITRCDRIIDIFTARCYSHVINARDVAVVSRRSVYSQDSLTRSRTDTWTVLAPPLWEEWAAEVSKGGRSPGNVVSTK